MVSLGFYGLGAFLVVIGFLGGSRGPFRTDDTYTADSALRRGRQLRRVTPEERRESVQSAAIAIGIGLALVALGVIIDSRYTLF